MTTNETPSPSKTTAANPVPSLNLTPTSSNRNTQDLLARQAEYADLCHKVAVGMLFAAPVIIALPPRKLDIYTVGLGFAWVYCLNRVTKSYGTDLMHVIGGKRLEEREAKKGDGGMVGWRGESVYKQHREREEEGKGIGEMIMESVWQQKDKRKLAPEEEEEEGLPLRERLARHERLERAREEAGEGK
jgi:hypothetical protein